jgi:3-methyl-2-oxobutanoate hydroxymethyltransferase
VLVSYDMLGLYDGPVPPFVTRYAHLGASIIAATRAYVDDVRSGRHPQVPVLDEDKAATS